MNIYDLRKLVKGNNIVPNKYYKLDTGETFLGKSRNRVEFISKDKIPKIIVDKINSSINDFELLVDEQAQDAIGSILQNTSTISLTYNDTTPYIIADLLSFGTLTTDDLSEGVSNLYFTNARSIGSTLTGYTSGAGTINSSDSILSAIQKLNGNVLALTTGVSSVFGRTGAVTAQSGDYNTSLVTESGNLYFTNSRVDSRVQAYTGDVTLSGTAFAIGNLKVTNAMLAGSIAYSKLTLTNSVVSGDIVSLVWSKITSTPTTLSGYGITDAQPLDSDLTAIAALTGTSGFLKTNGAGTWTVDTSTYLTTASAASSYQPLDTDLTTIAGLTATTDNFIVSVASVWASRTPAQVRTTLGLVIGTNVQAWDTDLDSWAAITRASGFDTFVATPSSANLLSLLTTKTGTGLNVFDTSPTIITPTIASFTNATHNHQNNAGGGTLDLTLIGGLTILPVANGGNTGNKLLYSNMTPTSVGATTAETQLLVSGLISDIVALDVIEWFNDLVCNNNANNKTLRLYINTTNSFSTGSPVLICTHTETTASQDRLGLRIIAVLSDTTVRTTQPAATNQIVDTAGGATNSSTTITTASFAGGVYFIITGQKPTSTSDTVTCDRTWLRRSR